jgi:hypothetical protein
MTKFSPIVRKPGEVIKSEDWNTMQEDIQADIEELENKLAILKDYVDNMEESATMLNMDSLVGKSYSLDEVMPGETSSYEAPIIGLLTKQWLLPKGKTGEICKFHVVAHLTSLDYWSGAEKGDKKALEIVFNYIDGTNAVLSGVFVHDRAKLRPKGTQNPYLEYLLSPNEHVWYRYQVVNPNPEKEVLSITFRNIAAECTPRVGNVIHYRSKITQRKALPE